MLSAIFVYEFGMPQSTMDLNASLGYAALVKNVTASCVQSCVASYQNVYVHTKPQFNVLADNNIIQASARHSPQLYVAVVLKSLSARGCMQ